MVIKLQKTNLTYWETGDERHQQLWWIGLCLPDCHHLLERLSTEFGVEPPRFAITKPTDETIVRVTEDPDLLATVIDALDEGWYETPTPNTRGTLFFDGVLTEAGNTIPLLLILHEMAHHLEYCRWGDLSDHGTEFDDALDELCDTAKAILGMENWDEIDWMRFQPDRPGGWTYHQIHSMKYRLLHAKWAKLMRLQA